MRWANINQFQPFKITRIYIAWEFVPNLWLHVRVFLKSYGRMSLSSFMLKLLEKLLDTCISGTTSYRFFLLVTSNIRINQEYLST